MNRLLRICLTAILVTGLFLIIRREAGVLSSGSDNADAVRIAGIPPELSSQTLQPDEPDSAPQPAQDAPPPAADEPSTQPEEAAQQSYQPVEATLADLEDVDLEALREVNGDVVGWILIPGTVISYPLMQGADNDYYLKHTWMRRYSTAGSIFLECLSDPSLEGFHTIIYGHRMSNGTMFGALKNYSSQSFWKNHPTVYVVSDAGVMCYDIFSAYEAGVTDIVYYQDLTGREEDFIQFCIDQSAIDPGIQPGPEDRIVTLSTCASQGFETRWTVHAVLREAQTPEEQ